MCQDADPVKVRKAQPSERTLIEILLPDYLSELGASPDYPYLPYYWLEPEREPYLIFVNDDLAGFALVRGLKPNPAYQVAEFYIVPAHREKGTGRAAAKSILQKHPGPWELAVLPENKKAYRFWDSVLEELTTPPIISIDKDGHTLFQFRVPLNKCSQSGAFR